MEQRCNRMLLQNAFEFCLVADIAPHDPDSRHRVVPNDVAPETALMEEANHASSSQEEFTNDPCTKKAGASCHKGGTTDPKFGQGKLLLRRAHRCVFAHAVLSS